MVCKRRPDARVVKRRDDLEPVSGEMTVEVVPLDFRADYGDCSVTVGGCFEAHFHEVGVQGYGSWGAWPPYVP